MAGKAKKNGDRGKNMAESKAGNKMESVESIAESVENVENIREDEMKNEEQGEKKRTYRKLSEISDEELRAAAAEAKSFPELKRLLGIRIDEENDRVRKRVRKAGFENLLDGYHVGKPSRIDGMTRDELQAIADECDTYTEFGRQLGYEKTPCAMGRKILDKYNLSFVSVFNSGARLDSRRFDKEYVQTVADNSYTFTEVAQALGYSHISGIHALLDNLDIDYSHFDPKHYQQKHHLTIDDLRENTNISGKALRTLLEELGIINCQLCGAGNLWMEKELILEVHHKNGKHSDNRLENLMLLCPTCHAMIEGKIGNNPSNPLMKRVLCEKGQRCEVCEHMMWQGSPIPIEFHHTDGNRNNNTFENIQILCPNCHSQTASFKSKTSIKPSKTDAEYINALLESKSIRQALKKLDLAVTGGAAKRAKRLIKEHNIKHLLPLKSQDIIGIVSAIQKGEDIFEIQQALKISNVDMVLIINGNHELSPHEIDYPLIDIKEHSKLDKRFLPLVSVHTKRAVKHCCDCGAPIGYGSKRCKKCNREHNQQNIPPREELKAMIRIMSFRQIGRLYNVSDNTVKKWCIHHQFPYRTYDINKFSDEEWNELDVFSYDEIEDIPRNDYEQIIELLDKTRSAQYVMNKLGIEKHIIHDARKALDYHQHVIEWSRTTCHIVGTSLYFRTSSDAGHWLAEQFEEIRALHQNSRSRKIQQAIGTKQLLCGYQFEYVPEKDYFDIIEKYEVISYAYQEHREIPPQVKK